MALLTTEERDQMEDILETVVVKALTRICRLIETEVAQHDIDDINALEASE